MNSVDLIPRRHLLDCDFWPGNFVVRDKKSMDDTGIILSVNYVDRTTKVEWTTKKVEEVPIYGVVKHPERKFKLGGKRTANLVVLQLFPSFLSSFFPPF